MMEGNSAQASPSYSVAASYIDLSSASSPSKSEERLGYGRIGYVTLGAAKGLILHKVHNVRESLCSTFRNDGLVESPAAQPGSRMRLYHHAN